ncbi:MAG: 16S rRNA (guanine(527)-N(7))-methyltransferase RsmG [Bacteroidales bacterium]
MMIIKKYFPEISSEQLLMFEKLIPLYTEWNSKINVISRKDIENLAINHILHSLAIAKIIRFRKGSSVLDVGTGGGLPGIPLAILFPEVNFHLIDCIGKKITVVEAIVSELGLINVSAQKIRAEELHESFDFIISRAVTKLPEFFEWVNNKISKKQINERLNGIIYLKGGDLTEELSGISRKHKVFEIKDFFEEEYFETKKVVYIY